MVADFAVEFLLLKLCAPNVARVRGRSSDGLSAMNYLMNGRGKHESSRSQPDDATKALSSKAFTQSLYCDSPLTTSRCPCSAAVCSPLEQSSFMSTARASSRLDIAKPAGFGGSGNNFIQASRHRCLHLVTVTAFHLINGILQIRRLILFSSATMMSIFKFPEPWGSLRMQTIGKKLLISHDIIRYLQKRSLRKKAS